ncbi:MAG TPA: hypothetical protein PKE29_10145 [Phycisphaerales bacterium]|jgi:hypothetical protein|nr:hypothetical protein [Phycisphaerales bacterium]
MRHNDNCHQRIWLSRRWHLLCGSVIAAIVLGMTIAAIQPDQVALRKTSSPGKLAASAIRALLAEHVESNAYQTMMSARHNIIKDGRTPMQDSYLAWLAAKLVQQAAKGQLFVGGGDKISLRLTWDMGDNAFWYVGRVSTIKPDGSKSGSGGPWVFWKYLGERVTPNGPDDKPSVSEYELPSVSEGDVIEFDLYRLPRNSVDIVERLDPVAAIGDNAAQIVLRLPLPVIVGTDPDLK